jgi:hypothetical protein
MNRRQLSWNVGLGVLGALGLAGCADPCVDDGLLQDRTDDCPAIASASQTDGESETDGDTEPDTDGNSCANGIEDGDETDVDCGGSCGPTCGDGEGCDGDEDCSSDNCGEEMTCEPDATCEDGVKNGTETDIDCGGGCPGCDDGEMCLENNDCMSMSCDPEDLVCEPDGSCRDGAQNGDETDVDCGGSCPDGCDDGEGCMENDDCMSMFCNPDAMVCEPGASCRDGAQNGDETDVDCGGSCPTPCDDGDECEQDSDCASQVCDERAGVCLPPACDDSVPNGDETDVDCGGSCPDDCDDGEGCLDDDDCVSGSCDENDMTCDAPSCGDGVPNGDETGVDCGGSCPDGCDDGEGCLEDDDCESQVCDEGMMLCLPPACDDGVANGDETDLDCGGSCGPTCETGEDCLVGLDCVDLVCDPDDNTCAPPLTVTAAPSCSAFEGQPVMLTAVAMGGTGVYTYSWDPADGLDDATSATPNASPDGFVTYTVTVDDGVSQASASATVVDAQPFNLQDNCTLRQGDFLNNSGPATISYSQGGTVACENGNNDLGLHLCESVVFQDVSLQGTIGVSDDDDDNDMIGLVWGAQDDANFYVMSWKRGAQNFGCNVPAGILVKRVQGPSFDDLVLADLFCPNNTVNSTLLLGTGATTNQGWEEGETYTTTIDYQTTGSTVTVVRDSDGVQIAAFDVDDVTFPSGAFGSITFSQSNACIGPLNATCL